MSEIKENLWAATSEGISIYNGAWSKLNLDEDINLNWSSNITPDRNNNIWNGTSEGVHVLRENVDYK